mmetsp:Transcript_16546/g.19888  ORF Transcript_16546/g.19888 Transcript_16546/m.19888 type:complete len:342 (+) Transcript_16546:88-1113(+)|eukprot:jgi/Bigna1/56668/estExt_Genewise1Plus.C_1120016
MANSSSDESTPIFGGEKKFGTTVIIGACVGSLLAGVLLTFTIAFFVTPESPNADATCMGRHFAAAKVWKEGNISFYGMSFNPDDDFSYEESRWENLACRGSGMQSPIDLQDDSAWGIANNLVPLKAGYKPSPLKITNNGKRIFFDFKKTGNWLLTPGGNYSLMDVRFHYPSEHTFNGARYAMEIQFFHKNQKAVPPADNKYGVLSVFVKEGEANDAFPSTKYKFSQFLPTVTGVEHTIQGRFDLLNLLPADHDSADSRYLFYTGSLTTPPCSENVKYYLYTDPIEMSKEQLDVFASVTKLLPASDKNGFNARPVQDIGDRAILSSTPPPPTSTAAVASSHY